MCSESIRVNSKPITNIPFWISLAVILSCLLLFVASYVKSEKFIYFWDYAAYWFKLIEFRDLFINDTLDAIRKLIFSIRHLDYNLIPIVPLLPFTVFGVSRSDYILSISISYIIPSIIFFSFFLRQFFQNNNSSNNRVIIDFFSIFIFAISPQLWAPALRGYLGAGGLLIAISILYYYAHKELTEFSAKDIFLMSFLIFLIVLFRRWYAYWVAGFFVSVSTYELINLFAKRNLEYRSFLRIAFRLISIGGLSFGFFFIICNPLATKILHTDYSDIYSAYKQSETLLDLSKKFIKHFGLITLLSALIGFFCAAKNMAARKISIVLIIQLLITFFMFTNTQDFGIHHYYILLLPIFFFSSYLILHVLVTLKSNKTKLIFSAFFVLLLITNFTVVFSQHATAFFKDVGLLFPATKTFPKIRNDIEEIENLLKNISGRNASNEKIYVLASGAILNDNILMSACKTLDATYFDCDLICNSAHVDKRDGLSAKLFRSKYIILTDPVQLHLGSSGQQVVDYLRKLIVNSTGIGRNYKKIDAEYQLDSNVKVFIYEKIGEKFNRQDIETISDYFCSLYPNHRDKFTFSEAELKEFSELTVCDDN